MAIKAVDYRGVFKSKTEVAEDVVKLSDENFLAFLLFAILGDGSIDIKKKRIELIMDKSKHGLWSDIIEKIKSLGFRERDGEYKMEYAVNYSKAVELARKIVSDQVSKALIEDLSRLLDAEKLKRLLVLASMRIKPLGRSMIEVVEGIRMNVCAHNYSVELRVHRMDYGEAVRILELLRNTGYRDAKLSKRSGRYVVYLNIDAIKKHPELVAKVCEVLRRMLEEVISEGKERRARSIARAMARLSCQ
ncbi:hypothetical protein [Vulcanisaeta sp. JCM 16161]|uniref:hypothetical protein n=1 Tax=Vulcanisaeta sp. JCM 16161 TaxID=1295372 RepID=UPI001FB4DAFB|nr:hypothetical protein [Vulcanisaeta sp. JCM 16161]